jgi:hypothetical protein
LDDGRHYLRPATPPRFFLETHLQSLDLLVKVPHRWLCFGHFGVCAATPEILQAHRRQLLQWSELIEDLGRRLSGPELEEACLQAVLGQDPLLAGWPQLPAEVQERERGFLRNSIRGFIGYLGDRQAAQG